VFHAHHLHRTGRPACRLQGGEQRVLLHPEMLRHIRAKKIKCDGSPIPSCIQHGFFGAGKFVVTAFMPGGHGIQNGWHGDLLV